MDFAYTEKVEQLRARLLAFFDDHIYPNEHTYHHQIAAAPDRWQPVPIIEELKAKARAAGLWNLFLPRARARRRADQPGIRAAGRDHGPRALVAEVFNCAAPDTGNMEIIERYGTEEQKQRWLEPLLDGEIRSCFAMTEPDVASSDATNIQTRIEPRRRRVRDQRPQVVVVGRRRPALQDLHRHGQDRPGRPDRHRQQSMILVPLDTPGVNIVRTLPVFGYDDAPHGHAEIVFDNVRVPASNILLGEGRGFEIAQGRLGPGRIHHCMRADRPGRARAGADVQARRSSARRLRQAAGRAGRDHERIAESRILIDQARLLTLKAAWHDGHGGQQGGPEGDRR